MNDYQKKYEALICKRTVTEVLKHVISHTERHHIKPVSIYPHLKNDKNNIVILTILEHILAHKYLMLWYKEEYGENDGRYFAMFNAYNYMTKSRNDIKLTDKEATLLRSEYARIRSAMYKGKPLSEKNRQHIKDTWSSEEKRNKQRQLLLKINRNNPQLAKHQSEIGKLRYANPQEHIKSSERAKKYNKLHPEKGKKHSEDIKGRIYIFNVKDKLTMRVKNDKIESMLADGWTLGTPLYYLCLKGKNRGKLTTIYVCPWKVSECSYLKPNSRGQKPKFSLVKPTLETAPTLKWITNGTETKCIHSNETVPKGWYFGRS